MFPKPETGEDTHTPNYAALRMGIRPAQRDNRPRPHPGTYFTWFIDQEKVMSWTLDPGETLRDALINTVVQDFMILKYEPKQSFVECVLGGFNVNVKVI